MLKKSRPNRQSRFSLEGPFGNILSSLHWPTTVLSFLVLLSALAVVYTKHYTRVLNAKTQFLQQQKTLSHTEWSQLLVEHSRWMNKAHIEQAAKETLDMRFPEQSEALVLHRKRPAALNP